MGPGPISAQERKKRPSWQLTEPHSCNTQGLVVSGFSRLPCSVALFLEFNWETRSDDNSIGGGKWLNELAAIAPITNARGAERQAAALAFTWTGLQKLGVPDDTLESFSPPFKEGMLQEDRLRRLGDRNTDCRWTASVIEGGPLWSGNTPSRFKNQDIDDLVSGGSLTLENAAGPIKTPTTVHALLVLYNETEAEIADRTIRATEILSAHGIRVVHQLSLSLRLDDNDVGREHFGFADGISQPIPYSAEVQGGSDAAAVVLLNDKPAERDPWHGVPLGEILFGHINAHHERAPGPVLRDDADGIGWKAGLRDEGAPEGYLNLGLDGSYLVVRELRQDVVAFWQSVEKGAEQLKSHDPSVTPQWLAERIVGRDIDGHLLCPSGVLAADEYNYPQNAFGFLLTDSYGFGCPTGSHVRRANPRDGLAKDEASAQTLLDASNNHRVLRRGRKYGDTIENPTIPDGKDRGLLFICLNTDITRQFEFVQQTWVLNSNFATLFDETDPLIGPAGQFTIRGRPLRHIVDVKTFVQMAGGEYFFLPSLPAIRYLASL